MTNILIVLPDFDTKQYSHILPSLERALISTADLLTLDASDVAKRAQVPPAEVRKLTTALLDGLNAQPSRQLRTCSAISTLDDGLDRALGGGIAVGSLTEIVGESAAGKTQCLLTLLLSVQLPDPRGLGKSALYISTEAPLQTTRLAQILNAHPQLVGLSDTDKPSLVHIHSTHIHDLEAQDHILRYQVPVVIKRHDVGLLVIDSIAANYRPEFDKGKARKTAAESFVKRSNQVAQLGALLRHIAQTYNIAVVVANQVADRFAPVEPPSQMPISQRTQGSRPGSPPHFAVKGTVSPDLTSQSQPAAASLSTDDPISLDHQQRFFTGWGDDPRVKSLKTPSLGLQWANQLATRIVLLKEPVYEIRQYKPGEEPNVSGWRRTFKVVFSSWCAGSSTEFEIVEGGVRSRTAQQVEATEHV